MHSPTTSNRSRRRALRALAVAAVAACALPASASAAQLSFDDGELRYDGLSDRNTLSLHHVAGALIVSDPLGVSNRLNNSINPGDRPCAQVDRQTMRCPVPQRVFADMDEGDDTIGPINTHLPVVIHGGSGRDTYTSRNPSFLTNVKFSGGSGVFDTVTYAGSNGSSGGRGVRISNDGVANDGRIGLDSDNIGRDVEKLTGSFLADEITANGARPFSETGEFAHTEVSALGGDDVVRVGSTGTSVVIENGPAANGADKLIAGSVPSIVDYSERSRPVNATIDSGGADDGEAGERDELIGDHGGLLGGRAGDTLRAPFFSRAAHFIEGGAGGDTIDGSEGPDGLTGGAGGDTFRAFGGTDSLRARDGETDTVDCGLQTDSVEVDSIDNFGNCENGTIGVLRLAPKTLRVKVAKIAKLRLSWRHPDSWRQLRRVTLSLYRGKARVGEVAISPRSRPIADRGAVRVVRRSTRLARKGKTVSAQLALRLDRKLAGRRLRVEVAAVDVRGARQLERSAGSIRVIR